MTALSYLNAHLPSLQVVLNRGRIDQATYILGRLIEALEDIVESIT